MRPGKPYPVEFAGAHGRGLKALGLHPERISGGHIAEVED
jgi:hypothetical protein